VKKIIYLILVISIISASIGYQSIDLEGGAIREDNTVWSKAPNMKINIINYSILPKKIEITFLNIKNESILQEKDRSMLINSKEKIILDLPPLSNKNYNIKLPSKDTLKFAVVGDSRQEKLEDPYPKVFKEIMADIDFRKVDFVIHLGDFVTHGEEKYFQEYEEIVEAYDVPVYTIIGNHEHGVEGNSLYKKYYGDTFYSFDYMGKKFIILDNSIGLLNKDNVSFLENELKFEGEKYIFMHMPPFDPRPSGIHKMLGAQEFMQLVEKNNVSNVFSGHVHMYHQVVQNNTKYVITGGSGSPIYASDTMGGFNHYVIYDQGDIHLINMEN